MTALIVNGWTILAHSLFLQQYDALLLAAIDAQSKNPSTYNGSKPAKLLAAVIHLLTEVIPADPTNPVFNQGRTLGDGATHWKRAKFYQQYRLFFRYDLRAKIIIIAWVNDDTTRRAYGSKSDAYRVFRKMLEDGHPPNSWDQLLAEARAAPSLADKISGQNNSMQD